MVTNTTFQNVKKYLKFSYNFDINIYILSSKQTTLELDLYAWQSNLVFFASKIPIGTIKSLGWYWSSSDWVIRHLLCLCTLCYNGEPGPKKNCPRVEKCLQ